MKSVAWTIMLTVLIQSSVVAGDQNDAVACDKVKKQIRVIESKMRNGYSAAQGIRYDEKLRELRKKRYKICR